MIVPTFEGNTGHLGFIGMYAPTVGVFVTDGEKQYEVLKVTTYQEKSGNFVEIVHVMTCLEVDEEGNDVGNDVKILKSTDESVEIL